MEGGLNMRASQVLAVLASGMLFGVGLALSTMVSPEVVLSFLQWRDAGLMLVMGGALLVTLVLKRPLLGGEFGHHVAVMDRDTLVGAAIFGVGWGLCGVCPGPAIAGLGAGQVELLWALAGIFAGAGLQGWQASR